MIWCVEDDNSIRDIEIYALQSTGFEARGFCDGKSFFKALKSEKPRLIILDVMLPEMDGIEILTKLKSSTLTRDIPVIMATAKGTEYDKIHGLDLGADDYLVKPFGVMEMISRVKAVLRRCNKNAEPSILRLSGIVLNESERTVTSDGIRLSLTFKEFELLRKFMAHPGVVFTRDQLFSDIWGSDFCGETRTVDIHIRTLRQKLGIYGNLIRTIRSVGYSMEGNDD